MLSRPAATTAAEVSAVLKEAFGDQRARPVRPLDSFPQPLSRYVRTCPRVRSVLSTKVNEAKAGTMSDEMLWDRFVDGLHPSSLRHDIRRA